MGLFSIILASLLVPHRQGSGSVDLEDPEKAGREVEPAAADDPNEQSSDPAPNDDITGDDESIQGSDSHDADEDEPGDSPSPPGRRVTFGITPSGESSPPGTTPEKPKMLARLKAFLLHSHEDDEHHSNHRILPVISGLVIPFSILLEIPGLTDSWIIRTNQNAVVQSLPNPSSLEVLLAISMFFAVVANVSLLCRFLEKGPVLATTLLTIASLTIHGNASLQNLVFDCGLLNLDLVNIIALVVFGVQRQLVEGFTYGHAYWMTGMSVVLVPESSVGLNDGFSVFHQRVERY